MNHILLIASSCLWLCSCAVQPPPQAAGGVQQDRWKQLEQQLEHKEAQRRDLRAILSSNPEAPEANELGARITQLNHQVRQLEIALSYAPTAPVSAAPIEPIAGLMPDERRAFAAADHSSFIADAKQTIASGLKDPNSVQFRKLRLGHEGFKPVLCGELNAKNSYGGYVGFRQFYVTQRNGDQAIDSDDLRFSELIKRKCADTVRQVD